MDREDGNAEEREEGNIGAFSLKHLKNYFLAYVRWFSSETIELGDIWFFCTSFHL